MQGPTENAFFIFRRKRKCRRKWNTIFGRKTKTKVTCSYITELSYGSVANIFGPTQMTFLELKRKIKQKWKFIVGRKRTKTKMTNSPFLVSTTKTNFGRLLVWWLDLSDPDPLRLYDRSTPLYRISFIYDLCYRFWFSCLIIFAFQN